jgi:hypothetical protein
MLEPFVLSFEFTDAPRFIDLGRIEMLAPALIGSLTDTMLAATIADGEPIGSIAFDIAQETLDLVSGPSLAHESLPGLHQGDYHNSWTSFWGADQVERVAEAPVSLISTRFHHRSIIDRRVW